MSRKMLVLCTLVLSLIVTPLVAQSPELPSSEAECGSKMIDRIDPQHKQRLERYELTLLGDPSIHFVGQNTRVTTGRYGYVDESGHYFTAEVTCSFTCGGGQQCQMQGCTPKSDGSGCTSFDCVGDGCSGSCTATTGGGGGEPGPEPPTHQ